MFRSYYDPIKRCFVDNYDDDYDVIVVVAFLWKAQCPKLAHFVVDFYSQCFLMEWIPLVISNTLFVWFISPYYPLVASNKLFHVLQGHRQRTDTEKEPGLEYRKFTCSLIIGSKCEGVNAQFLSFMDSFELNFHWFFRCSVVQ